MACHPLANKQAPFLGCCAPVARNHSWVTLNVYFFGFPPLKWDNFWHNKPANGVPCDGSGSSGPILYPLTLDGSGEITSLRTDQIKRRFRRRRFTIIQHPVPGYPVNNTNREHTWTRTERIDRNTGIFLRVSDLGGTPGFDVMLGRARGGVRPGGPDDHYVFGSCHSSAAQGATEQSVTEYTTIDVYDPDTQEYRSRFIQFEIRTELLEGYEIAPPDFSFLISESGSTGTAFGSTSFTDIPTDLSGSFRSIEGDLPVHVGPVDNIIGYAASQPLYEYLDGAFAGESAINTITTFYSVFRVAKQRFNFIGRAKPIAVCEGQDYLISPTFFGPDADDGPQFKGKGVAGCKNYLFEENQPIVYPPVSDGYDAWKSHLTEDFTRGFSPPYTDRPSDVVYCCNNPTL